MEKNMEDIFDISENTKPIIEVMQDGQVPTVLEKYSEKSDEIDADYKYARENLRSIIDSAQASIEDLSSIASTSESPRAYEQLLMQIKIY